MMRLVVGCEGYVERVLFATTAEELDDKESLLRQQQECDAPPDMFCPVCRRPRIEPKKENPTCPTSRTRT